MIQIENQYEDIRERQGIIYISYEIFQSFSTNYEMLSLLFSKFIPVDISMKGSMRKYECWGYCPDFDIATSGIYLPVYNVIYNSQTKEISFEKAEEVYRIYNSDEILPDRLFTIEGE